MDLGLKDKVAIVTGSARGLGLATAKRLAAEGARVMIADINLEAAQASAAAMLSEGLSAHAVGVDITNSADAERLVAETIGTFGAVHILVNNAGVPRDKLIVKMSEEEWDIVIDVTLKGAFLVSRAVMPHLIAQRWGRVINISSRAHFGNPGQANYSAAKAGIIGFTKALAIEQGRYEITVNALAPGFIATEMVLALPHFEKIRERALAAMSLQRVGVPADVANAVAYLASEQAAFITGETLHVTGGRYG
jgi:3-oxoacyl-[acyl-carrier protein] reductase